VSHANPGPVHGPTSSDCKDGTEKKRKRVDCPYDEIDVIFDRSFGKVKKSALALGVVSTGSKELVALEFSLSDK
jgi:hypothetical protein